MTACSLSETIKARCKEYLLEEPDSLLRNEIVTLLSLHDAGLAELKSRMLDHLGFGTAGLRAAMEAGYNRMNLVTVYRFCYAIGNVVLLNPKRRSRSVVIGYDGRLNSESFAKDAARILCSLGNKVYIFESEVPTPLCAFAVRLLLAETGIMITASHNPKSDNGIKFFNYLGAQASGTILSAIEKAMATAKRRDDFFRCHERKILSARPQIIGEEIFTSYLSKLKEAHLFTEEEVDHDLRIVYTALHGVGKRFFINAAKDAGFDHIAPVVTQSDPDGNFPTVFCPNPEEEDSLNLAHKFAYEKEISWVLANDPDADRLQVSVKDSLGNFKKLSGNEMGAILGYFAIEKALATQAKIPLVASSIVSSRFLKAISTSLGARYVEGLTGFSNIVSQALKIEERDGLEFVFAYEEAIGFLIGKTVLDKDGINAGVRFLEIAGYLKKCKKTVWNLLDELYQRFGIFINRQWSVRFNGIDAHLKMSRTMSKVRSLPANALGTLVESSECKKFDLMEKQQDNPYEGLHADVMIFEIDSVFRFIVRPSGTEPKIKFYLELCKTKFRANNLKFIMAQLEMRINDLRNGIEMLISV